MKFLPLITSIGRASPSSWRCHQEQSLLRVLRSQSSFRSDSLLLALSSPCWMIQNWFGSEMGNLCLPQFDQLSGGTRCRKYRYSRNFLAITEDGDGSCVQESLQRCQRLFGRLLRKEMPTGECLAGHFHGGARLPGRDDVEHPRGVSALGPQRQHRTSDLAGAVRCIVLEIDGSAGAVIFTGSVDG